MMASPKARVALLGDVNVDVTLEVPRFPTPGGEEISERIHLSLGGSVVNTARWLGAFGLQVRLAGCVGEDPWGEWALGELREAGIDTRWIQRTGLACTGIIIPLVEPSGERTMLGARGANAELRAERIPADWLDGVDWLHLSGYAWLRDPQRSAAERALMEARRQGIPVSLDLGLGAACSLRDALLRVALLLPSWEEAKRLSGQDSPEEALQALSSMVPGRVLIKLGGEGCLVQGEGGPLRLPPPQTTVRDTTGAGDAFDAGAIIGALWRWNPLLQAIFGNLLGALAAGCGPAEPLPATEEVLALIDRLVKGTPAFGPWLDRLGEFVQLRWRPEKGGRGAS